MSVAMPLHAASLPIVGPCPDREARARDSGEPSSWCNGCGKVVHDLTAMGEKEVRRLLARSVGTSICVDYRERLDGTIRTHEDARTGLATVCAAALTACASHLEVDELASPDDCADEDGCDDDPRFRATPDGPLRSENPDAPPSQLELAPADASSTRPEQSRPADRRAGERVARELDATPERDADPSVTMRVDFAVAPERIHRGCMVVGEVWHEPDGRLRFLPTRQVLSDLRERIRERRGR